MICSGCLNYLLAIAFAEVRGRVSDRSENTKLARPTRHSIIPRRSLAPAWPLTSRAGRPDIRVGFSRSVRSPLANGADRMANARRDQSSSVRTNPCSDARQGSLPLPRSDEILNRASAATPGRRGLDRSSRGPLRRRWRDGRRSLPPLPNSPPPLFPPHSHRDHQSRKTRRDVSVASREVRITSSPCWRRS